MCLTDKNAINTRPKIIQISDSLTLTFVKNKVTNKINK